MGVPLSALALFKARDMKLECRRSLSGETGVIPILPPAVWCVSCNQASGILPKGASMMAESDNISLTSEAAT